MLAVACSQLPVSRACILFDAVKGVLLSTGWLACCRSVQLSIPLRPSCLLYPMASQLWSFRCLRYALLSATLLKIHQYNKRVLGAVMTCITLPTGLLFGVSCQLATSLRWVCLRVGIYAASCGVGALCLQPGSKRRHSCRHRAIPSAPRRATERCHKLRLPNHDASAAELGGRAPSGRLLCSCWAAGILGARVLGLPWTAS